MKKIKRVTKVSPGLIKNKAGQVSSVLLKYSVYEAILNEMEFLKNDIARYEKKIKENRKKQIKK